MMNPKECNELIDALLDGGISEADLLRLEAEMSIDPAAQRSYLDRVALSQSLVEEAKLLPQTKAMNESWRGSFWLSWRPLTAAAAGIVFGMFCTAVAFGYVARQNAVRVRPLAVFEPGFENPQLVLAKGKPRVVREWSGEQASVVSAENGVTPVEGVRWRRSC